MEKIVFDSGRKTYEMGGGELSFTPSDPNVYARFMEATEKLVKMEDKLIESAKKTDGSGVAVLKLLTEADKEAKKILAWVFGEHNDFDKILNGVNLLAVGENGERVITNILNALLPIIQEGVEKCAKQQADQARAQAQADRIRREGK